MSLLGKILWKNSKENLLMKLTITLALILVIFISGCIREDITKSSGLIINLDAPEMVRNREEFSVFLELSNQGNQNYKVSVDFFDVGVFKKKSECKKEFELKPWAEQSFKCRLIFESEKLLVGSIDETIHSIIRYDTQFSIVKNFVLMSVEEYESRRISKRLEELPKVFAERNNDIEITVEFSENPIVARGVESYLYIKIRNVGNGFMKDLKKENIEINIIPNIPITCDIDEEISIERGEGIITCKIEVGNLKESYLNAYTIINIKYQYEIKKSASIKIVK